MNKPSPGVIARVKMFVHGELTQQDILLDTQEQVTVAQKYIYEVATTTGGGITVVLVGDAVNEKRFRPGKYSRSVAGAIGLHDADGGTWKRTEDGEWYDYRAYRYGRNIQDIQPCLGANTRMTKNKPAVVNQLTHPTAVITLLPQPKRTNPELLQETVVINGKSITASREFLIALLNTKVS